MNASKLGETIKVGKNQKTVLSIDEENKIINVFNNKEKIDDFSVVVSYDEIKVKNYSLNAGQYFDVKIEYVDITKDEFAQKMAKFKNNLNTYFAESEAVEAEIKKQLRNLVIE